jgi:hypothetical protein
MAHVRVFRPMLGLLRRDQRAVSADAEALVEILSRYDLPAFWTGQTTSCRGWAAWHRVTGESALASNAPGSTTLHFMSTRCAPFSRHVITMPFRGGKSRLALSACPYDDKGRARVRIDANAGGSAS